MNNFKNKFLNKKLPKPFGFIVLLISLVTIGWLSGNAILFGTRAAVSSVPKDVRITNIKEDSFTVSYITDDQIPAALNYGTSPELGTVILDNRDKNSNKPSDYRVHYITVPGLTPQANFYFKILSGDSEYDNNSVPYEVTTAPENSTKPLTPRSVEGKIAFEDGTTPIEGIVYVKTQSSQILSTLVTTGGNYSLDLSPLLTANLAQDVPLTDDTVVNMEIIDSTKKSFVSFLAGKANPIPPVILSKNYNFVKSDQPLTNEETASQSANFPQVDIEPATEVAILTPESDEKFNDQQPQFRGTAAPNSTVEITIESDPINTTVTADENGSWVYRPDKPLEPGEHDITVTAPNANGETQTISRSFIVSASGSQFTETALTPSPIQTPTEVPSPTPDLSPTGSPSPNPTQIITEVPSPTEPHQISPVPSGIIAQPTIPASGNPTALAGAFGIILTVIIGGILFFLL